VSRLGKVGRVKFGGYAASKFGTLGFTKTTDAEGIAYNVKATAVLPGAASTQQRGENYEDDQSSRTWQLIKILFSGRLLNPTWTILKAEKQIMTSTIKAAVQEALAIIKDAGSADIPSAIVSRIAFGVLSQIRVKCRT